MDNKIFDESILFLYIIDFKIDRNYVIKNTRTYQRKRGAATD